MLALLCEVHGRQSQVVSREQVCSLIHEETDVFRVTVLGRNVERVATVAADAADGVEIGARLAEDAEASEKESQMRVVVGRRHRKNEQLHLSVWEV